MPRREVGRTTPSTRSQASRYWRAREAGGEATASGDSVRKHFDHEPFWDQSSVAGRWLVSPP